MPKVREGKLERGNNVSGKLVKWEEVIIHRNLA